jgi:hypothetical protein
MYNLEINIKCSLFDSFTFSFIETYARKAYISWQYDAPAKIIVAPFPSVMTITDKTQTDGQHPKGGRNKLGLLDF